MNEAKKNSGSSESYTILSTTKGASLEPVIEMVSNKNNFVELLPTTTTKLQSNSNSKIIENGKNLDSPTTLLLKNSNGDGMPKILHQSLSDSVDKGVRLVKLEWPVEDWHSPNAPQNIFICGSYWGWKDHQVMEKLEKGFNYSLKLPVSNSAYSGPTAQNPFLFKFLVDGVWQCSKIYPISVDSQGIENNYLALE